MPSLFDSNRIGAGLSILANAARASGSASTPATGALGTIGGIANKLSGALNNLSRTGNIISAVRSLTLPSNGEIRGKISNASASFGDSDWRVRLSIPPVPSFTSSPIFAPLRNAGGAIFPYTPTIRVSNSASYGKTSPIHQNYSFYNYENSNADSISISAPFYCEDSEQAAYWVSMVHFLRSCTKMFTGEDDLGGNPPPIIFFNAYGDFVFKNVPVVVTNFSVDLDANSDYIATDVTASATTNPAGAPASALNTATTLIGALNPKAGAALSLANTIADGVKGLAGSFQSQLANAGGGVQGGKTYVPTKSTMTVSLQPIYSRDAARTFSLQKFVNGDYVKGGTGYI
jgi:hypothetical protein